jgi:hypothetical protein
MSEEHETETLDLFCPRCNILIAARIITETHGPVPHEIVHALDPSDSLYAGALYQLAICGRCNGVFLIESTYYEIPEEYSKETRRRILYPVERHRFPDNLPKHVARVYEEAVKAFTAGLYEPCVIMCRKCLEAVCRDYGATDGSLKTRLMELEKSGDIDSKLFSWANELRLVGNDAAHDLDIIISKADARDALEFVEAILLYVFSLNRRFGAFQERRKRRKNKIK